MIQQEEDMARALGDQEARNNQLHNKVFCLQQEMHSIGAAQQKEDTARAQREEEALSEVGARNNQLQTELDCLREELLNSSDRQQVQAQQFRVSEQKAEVRFQDEKQVNAERCSQLEKQVNHCMHCCRHGFFRRWPKQAFFWRSY